MNTPEKKKMDEVIETLSIWWEQVEVTSRLLNDYDRDFWGLSDIQVRAVEEHCSRRTRKVLDGEKISS